MFCKKCGKQIKDGVLFCTYCGEKITMPVGGSQEKSEPIPGSVKKAVVPSPIQQEKPKARGAVSTAEKTGQQKSHIFTIVIGVLAVIIVALVCMIFFSKSNKKEDEAPQGYEEAVADLETEKEPEEADLPVEEPEEEEPVPEPEESASQYFLPESDSRYLAMEELEGFTAADCRLARNELYARHGRRFNDENLQAHFDSCEWYQGTIAPEDFDESVLNEYELANRDLIVQYESVLEARGMKGTTVYDISILGFTEFNMLDGILTFSSDGGARYGENRGDSFYCRFPVADDCTWAYYSPWEDYPQEESSYEDAKKLIDSEMEVCAKEFQEYGRITFDAIWSFSITVTDGEVVDVHLVLPYTSI